jgi:DNA-directed RNA polymerase subunit H (RpoH/RPB5)
MQAIESVIPPEPVGPKIPEALELVQRMMALRGSPMPTVVARDRVLKSDVDELDLEASHVVFVALKEWMSAAKAAAARCTWVRIEHFLLLDLRQALNKDMWRHQRILKHPFTLKQLPVIKLHDPVVRVLGCKVGDVIQTQRSDGFYYRVVKEA